MRLVREIGPSGSGKWQQPHRPQVSAITQHQHSDLPEGPLLTLPVTRSHQGGHDQDRRCGRSAARSG